MAQLPPKSPTMATTNGWPDHIFSHQRVSSMEYGGATHNNPSWVDEFFDFSSTKRGSHRRSISDSVAFLEMGIDQECGRSSSTTQGSGNNSSEFDKFDDEQLMSMFTDNDVVPTNTMSCSNPSSPSDHNSISEDDNNKMKLLKTEPEEVDSSYKTEPHQLASCTYENSSEKIADPKRIKRILANRQSAQRSRVRKLQYISELERSVTSLQTEVSVLSPRVSFLDQQRMVLTVDNGVLKQRMAVLAQDKIFKDAHQEALKGEIERLRQIYYQQNMNKMGNDNNAQNKSQSQSSPMAMDATGPIDN